MGYVSRRPDEEHEEQDAATSGGAGGGNAPDERGGYTEVFAWPEEQREQLAQRLAAAYVGNLSRPEGEDDVLIDAVFEDLGSSGVVSLLSGASGLAGMLGRMLGGTQLLRVRGEELARVVTGSAEDLRREAETVDKMILQGEFLAAAKRLHEGLEQLAASLEAAGKTSKISRVGRQQQVAAARQLAPVARGLARGLGADLREGTGE